MNGRRFGNAYFKASLLEPANREKAPAARRANRVGKSLVFGTHLLNRIFD